MTSWPQNKQLPPNKWSLIVSNKALWQKVCVTDPKAVKPITGKQYSGNSPKPYWIVERLTDEFGPCGIGWGFTILNERMERLSESDVLHVAVVRFWYIFDGQRGELEQIGQTKAVYEKSKGGLMVDEDAPKKSVTDALIKCASYLGFAGDIFSGRWDDSKYVQEAGAEWDRKRMEADPQRREWLNARLADIKAAKSGGELKKVMAAAIDMVRSQGDQAAEDELNEAFADKLAQAKPKEQAA
jgi:hypothetical protein